MTPLLFRASTAVSGLGTGLQATLSGLRDNCSGLRLNDFGALPFACHTGAVDEIQAVRLPAGLQRFDCRNNRLALLALQQDGFIDAVQASATRWGAARVGVFLGTSTAGIHETELAYRQLDPTGALPADFSYAGAHNAWSLTDFVRNLLRLQGPASVVCTACSSSAKVFGVAQRMMETGLIDAAVVGGVDSLCFTTLYGFHALQLVSTQPCRPFDVARDGISIGEAAAFVLLERVPASLDVDAVLLAGVGESSDAYHMSSPHPQGHGAIAAMRAALDAASLQPDQVDYLNLHGTGTRANDSAEATAVVTLFGNRVPCSSTKGATGHTLGAAGALETVISALALRHGLIPGSPHTAVVEPQLAAPYQRRARAAQLTCVLSNSFGFGGANCTLALRRAN